jgi:hypothetical protein
MDEKLDQIIDKLSIFEKKLIKIEEEVHSLSKHSEFVDNLANSGAVSAVSSINKIISNLNPINYIKEKSLDQIKN